MPELPEVETIKRTLNRRIVGKKIAEVELFLPKIIRPMEAGEFIQRVKGGTIIGLRRRGKYLLIGLDTDNVIVINFRMTGRLVFVSRERKDMPLAKHTHLVFYFEDGCQLRFRDPRKFGTVCLIKKLELKDCPGLKNLGEEPLNPDFTEHKFRKLIIGRRKKIKQLLMDQGFIAGIGNIYADEILFRAGIHPERVSNTLTPDEIHYLYVGVVGVLTEAIYQKGTSIKDYVDGEGNTGNFQNFLQVYGRKGKACYQCGTPIVSMKLGGRTAHFCPCCQK